MEVREDDIALRESYRSSGIVMQSQAKMVSMEVQGIKKEDWK